MSCDWLQLASFIVQCLLLVGLVWYTCETRQIRLNSQREVSLIMLTMGVDALLRLDEVWQSPRLVKIRRKAAKALLEGNPNQSVDEVLDWFETVALLVRRGGFDEEFTWHTFYDWMVHYWCAAKDYIHQEQEKDPTAWIDLSDLMPRLFAREIGNSKRTLDEVYPTISEVQDFLRDETHLTESK